MKNRFLKSLKYIYTYLGSQSSKNILNKIKNKIPHKYKRIIKIFLSRIFANKN